MANPFAWQKRNRLLTRVLYPFFSSFKNEPQNKIMGSERYAALSHDQYNGVIMLTARRMVKVNGTRTLTHKDPCCILAPKWGLAHGLSGFGTNHLMAGISTLDGDIIGNITKNGILYLNKGYRKKNKGSWFSVNRESLGYTGGSFGLGSLYNFFGR
jgi:hypothetical protein